MVNPGLAALTECGPSEGLSAELDYALEGRRRTDRTAILINNSECWMAVVSCPVLRGLLNSYSTPNFNSLAAHHCNDVKYVKYDLGPLSRT